MKGDKWDVLERIVDMLFLAGWLLCVITMVLGL